MVAVVSGHTAGLQLECARGADLETLDRWERNAWLLALHAGNVDAARVLLSAGARSDVRGRCGVPALSYAVRPDLPELVDWLVEAGADIDYVDGQGYSLLRCAAERGDEEFIVRLLELGASPNLRSLANPALHTAIAWDQLGIARRLIEAGADPNALDLDGDTALPLARSVEAVILLVESGADPNIPLGHGGPTWEYQRDDDIAKALRAATDPRAFRELVRAVRG